MRATIALALIVGIVGSVALLLRATAQDATQGTVGWFALATGTVGITQGQTLRLSVVNVGAVDALSKGADRLEQAWGELRT